MEFLIRIFASYPLSFPRRKVPSRITSREIIPPTSARLVYLLILID
jgi:hypothetical protein